MTKQCYIISMVTGEKLISPLVGKFFFSKKYTTSFPLLIKEIEKEDGTIAIYLEKYNNFTKDEFQSIPTSEVINVTDSTEEMNELYEVSLERIQKYIENNIKTSILATAENIRKLNNIPKDQSPMNSEIYQAILSQVLLKSSSPSPMVH